MPDLSNYTVGESLHRGAYAEIRRAERLSDGAQLVLKMPRSDRGGGAEDRLRREFEVTRGFDDRGLMVPEEWVDTPTGGTLAMHEFGSGSLEEVLASGEIDLTRALRIALQIVSALEELHDHGFVHAQIHPRHILYDSATEQLKLIDFSLARNPDDPSAAGPGHDEEITSADFAAPEQTGKTNRFVDYRTDYYSFGVLLYQLVTGRLPFRFDSDAETLHAHVAKSPPRPDAVDRTIPEPLADIVMKLLSKRLEDRYQSAAGLRSDLARCRDEWIETGQVTPFEIGKDDVAERFRLPQKLYGREEQLEQLAASFAALKRRESSLFLVGGVAGVGKSALIAEFGQYVVRERGIFVEGKCDQFRRNVPYEAFIAAFRSLLRQVLTESDEVLDTWRSRLSSALGVNAGLIIDVIPELELILGERPEARTLPATESLHRFNLTFQAFARACTTPERPLVIFFDDLQWSDPASARLIELLMEDESSGSVMIVGAYRSEEIDAMHPVMLGVAELERRGLTIKRIELAPLSGADIREMFADVLHIEPAEAAPLASVLVTKTGGNAFFLLEFLRQLDRLGLVGYDRSSRSWTWNIEEIQRLEATENVAELLSSRLQELPEKTLEVLVTASAIGADFELEILATTLERSPATTADQLWPAIRQGLVVPVRGGYRLVSRQSEETDLGYAQPAHFAEAAFKFAHDRVQAAAAARMSEADRPALHLRIAQAMLAENDPEQVDEDLFLIADQFNAAGDALLRSEYRERAARIHLAAASRAQASNAFEGARTYARSGCDLLTDKDWSLRHDLARDLHMRLAENGMLSGQLDEAEKEFRVVVERSRDALERAEAMGRMADLYTFSGRTALPMLLEGLKLIDEPIKARPGKLDVLRAYLRTRWHLRGVDVESLVDRPLMQDRRAAVAMELLVALHSQGYQEQPELSATAITSMVVLSLKHGNHQHSPLAYSLYGALLTAGFRQLDLGLRFGEVGLSLSQKLHEPLAEARSRFVMQCLLRHWCHPFAEDIAYAADAYRLAIENGDLFYASISNTWSHHYLLGHDLERVADEIEQFRSFTDRAGISLSSSYTTIGAQLVAALRGETGDVTSLTSGDFDEDAYLRDVLSAQQLTTARTFYYLLKAELLHLGGEFARVAELLDLVSGEEHALRGQYVEAVYHYLRGATFARLAAGGDRKARRTARKSLKKLASWAESAPSNFLSMKLGVEAALASNGEVDAATFERAYTEASRSEYPRMAVSVAALAVSTIRDSSRPDLLEPWEERLGHLLENWKADGLRQKLLPDQPARLPKEPESAGEKKGLGSDVTETYLRAGALITGELVLSRLLEQLMKIIVEFAGAESGAFLLNDPVEGLRVAATVADGGDRVQVTDQGSVTDASAVPESVVNFAARSGETIVLSNASEDARFGGEPGIADRSVASLLCLPLQYRGRLVGILYAENNQSADVFDDTRVEPLHLLASQMASSIENARLFEHLRELNQAYERFVPHEFIELLQQTSVTQLELGDQHELEMTILFSDIRDFTPLTESLSPNEAFAFINEFLAVMGPVIRRHGGFIDKYIGDSIMALFPSEPDGAFHAAREMRGELDRFNSKRQEAGHPPIEFGTGIHTGRLIIGIIGEHRRLEGTVVSDAVNIASRVESLTKEMGRPVLLTRATADRLSPDLAKDLELLGTASVKGRKGEVEVLAPGW